MKRSICLLISVIILFACTTALSEEDITFLNIPWLSNETTAVKALLSEGYIRSEQASPLFSYNESFFLLADGHDGAIDLTSAKQDKCCVSMTLGEQAKGRIAGCGVSDITLTFAYDGEYQLIFAKVDFLNAEYQDIIQKLKKVYGEGEQYNMAGDNCLCWKGANHSCVVLFESYGGQSFDLCYGRLDAAEILANCHQIDPDDVSGL